MKLIAVALTLPLVVAVAPAVAGPQHNLGVTVAPPAGVHVNQFGTYGVTVTNTGNRHAYGVTLSIALPRTHTSPQVFIMGNLANVDPRCSLSAQTLTCNLGQVNKNGGATTVTFDLKLPYSTAPLAFTFTANPIAGDSNAGNNTLPYTASPALYDNPIAGPVSLQHDHCTGQGLTSYFECTLFPSSITGFAATYNSDHTVTIPGEPTFSGTWTQVGGDDRLQVTFADGGTPVATLDARGVDNGCFEGPMTFIPASPYLAMYRVCP
jgi:uncharacterized repeat protein (TIGR01451 family)